MKARFEHGIALVSRGFVALMAIVMIAGSVSPADAGGWKNRKHRRHEKVVVYRPAPVVVHRHSHNGDALAGFIGGVVVGTVLASTAHAEPAPSHYYYDPYCGTRYSSFDVSRAHFAHCSHPQVIQVVEYGSGRCVDTYRWHHGHWHDGDCCR
jgi:hypothetical protein